MFLFLFTAIITAQPMEGGFYSTENTRTDTVIKGKDFIRTVDSLFQLEGEQVFAERIGKNPSTVFGAAFRTLPYSYESVINKLQEYHRHSSSFRIIRQFENPGKEEMPDCFYIQCRVAFYKAWFLMNIDSVRTGEDSTWTMILRQVHHNKLEPVYQNANSGWFTYETEDFYLVWRVKPLGNVQTRVCIAAVFDIYKYLPGWMFRMGARYVVPEFLEDLEKSLKNS